MGFGGAFVLVRNVKARLIRTLERKVSKGVSQRAGMITGAIRGFMIVISLATTAHVAPLFPWKEAITESSFLGTMTGLFFPGDEAVEESVPDQAADVKAPDLLSE